MSIFEISLALIVVLVITLSFFSKRIDNRIVRTLAIIGLLLMLVHFIVDTPRWPMLPFYVVGILCPFVILIRINGIIKMVVNSITIILLMIAALVSALVPEKPYLDYQASDRHQNRLITNYSQSTHSMMNLPAIESQQPILLFSKPGQYDEQDFSVLISKLVEKGFMVMSIGPSCEEHHSSTPKYLIKKETNAEIPVFSNTTIVNENSEMHYAIYSPE